MFVSKFLRHLVRIVLASHALSLRQSFARVLLWNLVNCWKEKFVMKLLQLFMGLLKQFEDNLQNRRKSEYLFLIIFLFQLIFIHPFVICYLQCLSFNIFYTIQFFCLHYFPFFPSSIVTFLLTGVHTVFTVTNVCMKLEVGSSPLMRMGVLAPRPATLDPPLGLP